MPNNVKVYSPVPKVYSVFFLVLYLVCHVYRVSLRGCFKKPRELNALAVPLDVRVAMVAHPLAGSEYEHGY